LFDGACSLCNRAVRFIARRDPEGRFRFASLQSRAAEELLGRSGWAWGALDAIVLAERGGLYAGSEAILRIARHLSGPWPLLSLVGRALPRSVREALYRFVARNRYRWFGRREQCSVPDERLGSRFLD